MTDFLRNKFGQSGVAQHHKATRRDAIGGMKKSMAQIKLKYVNGFRNRDRKSQRVRYYFRRRGAEPIALPGLPGSEEFMAAYHAALAALPDKWSRFGAGRTSPGTIIGLVVAYYKSPNSNNLAPDTRNIGAALLSVFAFSTATRVALLVATTSNRCLPRSRSRPRSAVG